MTQLLALAALVALVTACSGVPRSPAETAFNGPGAATAAALGYHGPVERARAN
jgi:hypothetical protein